MSEKRDVTALGQAVVEPSRLGFQVQCDGIPIGAMHTGHDGGAILSFRARRHAQAFAEAWNDDDFGRCQVLIDDHGTFLS